MEPSIESLLNGNLELWLELIVMVIALIAAIMIFSPRRTASKKSQSVAARSASQQTSGHNIAPAYPGDAQHVTQVARTSQALRTPSPVFLAGPLVGNSAWRDQTLRAIPPEVRRQDRVSSVQEDMLYEQDDLPVDPISAGALEAVAAAVLSSTGACQDCSDDEPTNTVRDDSSYAAPAYEAPSCDTGSLDSGNDSCGSGDTASWDSDD